MESEFRLFLQMFKYLFKYLSAPGGFPVQPVRRLWAGWRPKTSSSLLPPGGSTYPQVSSSSSSPLPWPSLSSVKTSGSTLLIWSQGRYWAAPSRKGWIFPPIRPEHTGAHGKVGQHHHQCHHYTIFIFLIVINVLMMMMMIIIIFEGKTKVMFNKLPVSCSDCERSGGPTCSVAPGENQGVIIIVINKTNKNINKMLRYSCCQRRQGKEGCRRKWACCR